MSASEIPVIDISNPSPGVAKQVFDAASTHGFLFIKNDGLAIPQSDIDAMFSLVIFFLPFTQRTTTNLNIVQSLLRLPNRAQSRIRHPFRQSRRCKPRLGPHVRRSARSVRHDNRRPKRSIRSFPVPFQYPLITSNSIISEHGASITRGTITTPPYPSLNPLPPPIPLPILLPNTLHIHPLPALHGP